MALLEPDLEVQRTARSIWPQPDWLELYVADGMPSAGFAELEADAEEAWEEAWEQGAHVHARTPLHARLPLVCSNPAHPGAVRVAFAAHGLSEYEVQEEALEQLWADTSILR